MITYEFTAIPKNGMIKLPDEIAIIKNEIKFIAITNSKTINNNQNKDIFSALKLKTKNYKFNRDEANER